jgi:hypothetical protein
LSREQFMWGLSNGVVVLSISAAFWIGLAAWTLGAAVFLIALVPILLLGGLLIWQGLRIRRLAPGFSRASLRNAPKGSSIRRIGIGFNVVGTMQTVSIGVVGFTCWKLNRTDLVWPLIGLVISLHFLPLGWIFSVRPYYVLGVLGTAVSLASLLGFTANTRPAVVGLGLGLLISGCALYLVANAAALADAALRRSSLKADAPA